MIVKICGITSQQDAEAAIEAGAEALGFIFSNASPRHITPARAGSIIKNLPNEIMKVGVFVDSPRDVLIGIVRDTGIGCIQLHGEEEPEYARGLPGQVWKAFRVGKDFDILELDRFHVAAYLLDTFAVGRHGGTGHAFDWRIAEQAKRFGNIVLSGGITPQNVADAMRTVRPYAIDVNSGVESSPGKKDKQKMKTLFDQIRRAEEVPC